MLQPGKKPHAIEANPNARPKATIYRWGQPPEPSSRRPAAPPEREKERGGNYAWKSTLKPGQRREELNKAPGGGAVKSVASWGTLLENPV